MLPEDHKGFVDHRCIYIKASGLSGEYPITIRGDHPDHPGVIVGLNKGYTVKIERRKHIVFYNITFEGFNLLTEPLTSEGDDITITTYPRSKFIIFDGCTMKHGNDCFAQLYTGHDHWVFRNNTIMYGGMGIVALERGGDGVRFLTVEDNTIMHMGTPPYEHQDAHAVGIQGGQGHLIKGNYIEDTGSAIAVVPKYCV